MPLLSLEFKKAGIDFSRENRSMIDVMRIYHKYVSPKEGGKRHLTDAYKYYCGEDLLGAHRATNDIMGTVEMLGKQIERHSDVPHEVYALSQYCGEKLPEYVDQNGKIIWKENDRGEKEIILNYVGPKHRGKPLKDIITSNPDFVKWVLEPKEFDFSEEVKEIFRNAQHGIYPAPPVFLR